MAADLQKEFPGIQGYSARNIWYMRIFYITYRENTKLQPMVAEISWTKHLVILDRCADDLEKEFYIRMTRKFGWTKNVLIHQIEKGRRIGVASTPLTKFDLRQIRKSGQALLFFPARVKRSEKAKSL